MSRNKAGKIPVRIWVDADACPKTIKEILFRAARRTGISLTLVANSPQSLPYNTPADFILVKPGDDAADRRILEKMTAGDLVITADIPLAAEVIKKRGGALNPSGELYTEENVHARLSMRDFMAYLRSNGIKTGGPAPFSRQNREDFARQLEIWLNGVGE